MMAKAVLLKVIESRCPKSFIKSNGKNIYFFLKQTTAAWKAQGNIGLVFKGKQI